MSTGMLCVVDVSVELRTSDNFGAIDATALTSWRGAADLYSKSVGCAEDPCSEQRFVEGGVRVCEPLDRQRHTAPIGAVGGTDKAGGQQLDRCGGVTVGSCSQSEARQ